MNMQNNTGRKKRTVRYDRIIMSFASLAALILLLVLCLNGVFKDKSDVPADARNTEESAPLTVPKADNSKLVFLSPSNQLDNEYTGQNTTEGEQMRLVANAAKKYLNEWGIQVRIAGEELLLTEKVALANELGVGIYVSIHSNAGEGGKGTEAFYNPVVPGSYELAKAVFSSVAALTPTDDREIIDVHDTELYEIANTTVPAVLVEVEFHDNYDGARWIVDNIDELGLAVAEGIKQYYDTLSDSPPDTSISAGDTSNTSG